MGGRDTPVPPGGARVPRPPVYSTVRPLLGVDELLHVRRDDLPRRLVELHAQPAHHGREVGELPLLDDLDHAGVAAVALLGLAHAVGSARQRHIEAPLLAANPAGSHEWTP